MKFTKAALAALMMTVMAGSGQAATTATISETLTIDVSFTQPSCDISVPGSYGLGQLNPGTKEHGELNITWTCEGDTPLQTALTAGVVKGNRSGDDAVILMTGADTASGATLSLIEKKSGQPVKLTGHEEKNYFCSDSGETIGMRTCTLIPKTTVNSNGPFGLASATLSFEVAYP